MRNNCLGKALVVGVLAKCSAITHSATAQLASSFR